MGVGLQLWQCVKHERHTLQCIVKKCFADRHCGIGQQLVKGAGIQSQCQSNSNLQVQQACNVCVKGIRNLRVQQACKVCMEPLVSADELIGEGETMHEPSLLQPEYATEAVGHSTKVRQQKPC